MKFTRIKPVTGDVASESEAMQAADVSAVAGRAAAAFPAWSALGPNARRARLMKAAAALEARRPAAHSRARDLSVGLTMRHKERNLDPLHMAVEVHKLHYRLRRSLEERARVAWPVRRIGQKIGQADAFLARMPDGNRHIY